MPFIVIRAVLTVKGHSLTATVWLSCRTRSEHSSRSAELCSLPTGKFSHGVDLEPA